MKKISCMILSSAVALVGVFGVSTVSKVDASAIQPKSSEVTPFAIFDPDRCIVAKTVQKVGSGWYVTTPTNTTYFLDIAAKHGVKNPSAGREIEIMMGSQGRVAGWKVL